MILQTEKRLQIGLDSLTPFLGLHFAISRHSTMKTKNLTNACLLANTRARVAIYITSWSLWLRIHSCVPFTLRYYEGVEQKNGKLVRGGPRSVQNNQCLALCMTEWVASTSFITTRPSTCQGPRERILDIVKPWDSTLNDFSVICFLHPSTSGIAKAEEIFVEQPSLWPAGIGQGDWSVPFYLPTFKTETLPRIFTYLTEPVTLEASPRGVLSHPLARRMQKNR